jgi:hypothetical protein
MVMIKQLLKAMILSTIMALDPEGCGGMPEPTVPGPPANAVIYHVNVRTYEKQAQVNFVNRPGAFT